MTSINGANHMASLALRGLDKSSDVMLEAMERLSSGKRINRSKDDASGMAISLVHKAQTAGLGGAVKHASDAIGVVKSIEGSLNTANDLLLRLKELSVQASSEINTQQERNFMQDEVNQINLSLNSLATDTEFNNKKLLNGTYNAKITIGKDGQEFVNLSINPMDASSIGSHEIYSFVHRSESGGVATLEIAETSLNSQFSSNADYTLKGANGTTIINMNGGESARDVARAFNLATGETGVTASVLTQIKIKSFDNIYETSNISFNLKGKDQNASKVTSTIDNFDDLTGLKNSINSVSSSTGIVASLVDNNSSIILTQNEGYNISISEYKTSNFGTPTQMNIDVLGKNSNGNTTSLYSAYINGDPGSTNLDSVSLSGQLTLNSSKAFSIISGDSNNHFNSSTSAISSSFTSISDISLSTVQSASNAMARIDSALSMISEMRSEMGAKSVRFQSIISNLTNIELNTQKHVDLIEDAEFTTETSKLARSQVIQQASTAMIAQANNINNFMMSFLNQFK